MGKDKLDTLDFMSFINSMSKIDEMNTPIKNKKAKCAVKESGDGANNEDVVVNKDIKDIKDIKETEKDDDVITDSDGSDGSDGSEEEDVDVEEDYSDDEDDDEDFDLTDENLYNLFNSFFTDEYGVNVATSMSNIAYELHNLNKNLSKMLKDKEKK